MYTIFVSSTTKDLGDYRRRARDIILEYGLVPIEMGDIPAQSSEPRIVIERCLDVCDAVVLIAGACYGSLVEENKSYVQFEFERAHARQLQVICLIQAEAERNRLAQELHVDAADRALQEQFIAGLKHRHYKKTFDTMESFTRTVGPALSHFRRTAPIARPSSGWIRVKNHQTICNTEIQKRCELEARAQFLYLLSGLTLTHESSLQVYREKDCQMSDAGDDLDENLDLDKILTALHHDMSGQPLTSQIVAKLMLRFIRRLQGFSIPEGFRPESEGELEVAIDELFGASLHTLRATSIHSNHPDLAGYKGYWEDAELGPFFKRKNGEFLARGDGREAQRVYACDSIADSVAESWFKETVVDQVRQGASVKVTQINQKHRTSYEDFGLYEHRSDTMAPATYLLLAPKEANLEVAMLRTSVIADRKRVKDYTTKFKKMWDQSQPLEIVKSVAMDAAATLKDESYGEGTVNDLLKSRVVLRRMVRLDSNASERVLLPPSAGFVRKYEDAYGKAVSDHIRKGFPGTKHLLYVGDTFKNDGSVVRRLQNLEWDMSGFICDNTIGLERLWFDRMLYTKSWSDLVGFADIIRGQVGTGTLALFDIDQTLWAPKGVHEGPLVRTRTEAMKRLIDKYTVDKYTEPTDIEAAQESANQAKERIGPLYSEISDKKYINSLTLDNEDYKAAICVFLALNIRIRPVEHVSAKTFRRLRQMPASSFVEHVMSSYLPSILRLDNEGPDNIQVFIALTLANLLTAHFTSYCGDAKIDVRELEHDVSGMFLAMQDSTKLVKYAPFREMELQEALVRTDPLGDFDDRLVLNKPAWDFATWLRKSGAELLGLSDRPDEATVSDSESLLDARMTIYGRSISQFLDASGSS